MEDFFEVYQGYQVEQPLPGPCGQGPQQPTMKWLQAECPCGKLITLRPQETRPLAAHVRTCATLHRCTGRGEALLTCGDVEANPGPLSPRDTGSPIRFRAKRARPLEQAGNGSHQPTPLERKKINKRGLELIARAEVQMSADLHKRKTWRRLNQGT